MAASYLPDVPIYASDTEMSHTGHFTYSNVWSPRNFLIRNMCMRVLNVISCIVQFDNQCILHLFVVYISV
jgi:hypothetical protein